MVKTIEIQSCQDCPMKNYSYDDFSMGDYESHSCILLQQEWSTTIWQSSIIPPANYFINFYKNGNVKSKNKKTLDNCPLLNQDINITLK